MQITRMPSGEGDRRPAAREPNMSSRPVGTRAHSGGDKDIPHVLKGGLAVQPGHSAKRQQKDEA